MNYSNRVPILPHSKPLPPLHLPRTLRPAHLPRHRYPYSLHWDVGSVFFRHLPANSCSDRHIRHRTALVSPADVWELVEITAAAVCHRRSPAGGAECGAQARAQLGPLQAEVEEGGHGRETCGNQLHSWLDEGPVAHRGGVWDALASANDHRQPGELFPALIKLGLFELTCDVCLVGFSDEDS